MELALDEFDALFEELDFLEQDGEGGGEGRCEHAFTEEYSGTPFGLGRPFGDRKAELTQEAAKGIDASVPGFLPLFTDAVQWLELLLVDGAHRHRLYPFTAMGFEQGFGIDTV